MPIIQEHSYYVFDDRIYERPEFARQIAVISASNLIQALERALEYEAWRTGGYVLACQKQTTEFVGDVAGLFPIHPITLEIMRSELDKARNRGDIDRSDILASWLGEP